MTPEQKAAVSACITAFHIPLDSPDFVIKIHSDPTQVPFGSAPAIAVEVEATHASMAPHEVKL